MYVFESVEMWKELQNEWFWSLILRFLACFLRIILQWKTIENHCHKKQTESPEPEHESSYHLELLSDTEDGKAADWDLGELE